MSSRALSLMERAPTAIIYALHGPYCLYLMLRHGGITLPTMANPGIEGSGLSHESKTDLFNLMGPTGRAHLPPFTTIRTGPAMVADAIRAMDSAGLAFPVVVKPDIGRRGFGVRIVQTHAALAEHLHKFPAGIRLLIQQYAVGPGEVGIFYMRRPSAAHGQILSLTIKHFPEVVGTGNHTLRQLILQDERARGLAEIYLRRNRLHLDRVLAQGERYRLVSIGNHVRGAKFEDGSRHITPAMTAIFDTISQEVPGFYIGRFDVRYSTLDELKAGKGFLIVEYNGASGEPTHIWDRNTSIAQTYAGLLEHCRHLFEIGAENRALGARPIGLGEVIRRHFRELRLLRSYPDEE